jgi:uncharacterized protein Yka (UPF0111/DUF47 family)
MQVLDLAHTEGDVLRREVEHDKRDGVFADGPREREDLLMLRREKGKVAVDLPR